MQKDVYIATNVISDMLRQKESPARSQIKVVRGVFSIGLCISRFLSEKVYSTRTRKIGIETRRQILQRAPGANSKLGKEKVHREGSSKSVRLMSAALARQKKIGERSHEETLHQGRCARKAPWDLAKKYKLGQNNVLYSY